MNEQLLLILLTQGVPLLIKEAKDLIASGKAQDPGALEAAISSMDLKIADAKAALAEAAARS